MWRRSLLGILIGGAASLQAACAHARNYMDPDGPGYSTRHGKPPVLDEVVRVVSFNIKHARRIDEAIGVLREEGGLAGADLLLLQEMDAPGTERIARALAMNSIYFPSTVHPHDGKDFGNAVLSPWPIEDERKLLLPHESRIIRVRRAATIATVRIGTRRVRAYSIHLETQFRLGPEGRRDQAAAVLDDALRSPDPVVIGGDLNSRSLAGLFESAGFAWLTPEVNRSGWLDFDHVFARGLTAAGRPASGSTDARGASDHRPVWAALRFSEPS